jgi:hypothetical protein
MQLTLQGCAVANLYDYYFEIRKNYNNPVLGQITSGVYISSGHRTGHTAMQHHLMRSSDKVWRQGPKGGVKIIKDRAGYCSYQYVTNNEAEMKQFMWVKLKARSAQLIK